VKTPTPEAEPPRREQAAQACAADRLLVSADERGDLERLTTSRSARMLGHAAVSTTMI